VDNECVVSGDSLTNVWRQALRRVYWHGTDVAPRGQRTKEILAAQLTLTDPVARIPLIPFRRWSLAYAAGELAWYLCGSDNLEYIKYYAPSYGQFSDDGAHLYGAYGPRIFGPCVEDRDELGQSQQTSPWLKCQRLLRNDPDTRQAVIPIYAPTDVGAKTKDYPCTLALQFLLRDGHLNLITTMRSNDLWLGTLYDIFCFTALQELMAQQLGAYVGEYVHQVGSLHLYERNWSATERILEYYYGELGDNVSLTSESFPLRPNAELQLPLRAAWTKSLDAKTAEARLTDRIIGRAELNSLEQLAETAWLWKRVQLGVETSEAARRTLEELLRQKLGGVFNFCFH